jgi:hypothetical protein
MSDLMLNLLITIEQREGVGEKSEQFTTSTSISLGLVLVDSRTCFTTSKSTS